MLNRMVVVAFLVAACDRGANKPAGPDCSAAASALVTSLGGKDAGSAAGSAAQQAKTALVTVCTTDKWSADARSCIAKATTEEAQNDCWYKQLTGEQADHLKKASRSLGSVDTAAAMKKMHEFADKMCACKDSKCAQSVADEMTKWSQEMSQKMKEPPRMSEEETKEAQDLGERMGKCMQTAMGAGDPPPPPINDEGGGGAM